MTNLHSNRQLIFSDENNDKQSVSVTILEVFRPKMKVAQMPLFFSK